jgi:hypothetical protein
MGTKQETRPTPIPANTRPTTKRGSSLEAVCIAIPTEKTRHADMIPNFRPMMSATGEARRAPGEKKVNIENIGDLMKRFTDEGACRQNGYDE